jgi:carbohydrate diacid regulator
MQTLISEELAQEIADKIMHEIPYNVNIMNEKGIIIGSGDRERIGTLHNGAVMAIENQKVVTLHRTSPGGKPGVNIPITFQNKIIGVVGISGDPDIITPFAAITKTTVELLINQNYLFNERRMKERLKSDFLFQWSMRTTEYDKEFISQGMAVDIDVSIPRFALVIKGNKLKEQSILKEEEYALPINESTYVYLLKSGKKIDSFVAKLLSEKNVFIGVGKEVPIITHSIQQALQIISITEKMKWDRSTIYYERHQMIDRLLQSNLDVSDIVGKYDELNQTDKGIDFIETLKCYIEKNGNINEVAQTLHIHRNSLNYRLDRIESIFHLNPRNFEELFTLYLGLIFYFCRD